MARRKPRKRSLAWRAAGRGASWVRRAASPAAAALLAPTAGAALYAAARSTADIGAHGEASWFVGGAAALSLAHLAGAPLRPLYVFAHELTHALAAWAGGGKVYAFVVKGDSGRVDLSHAGPFVALAPYWVPLYALACAAVYRGWLWYGAPPWSRQAFLAAMGAALAFHLLHTARSLWQTHQSDLDEAGPALSLALIALLNAAVLLAAFKCLFPDRVSLGAAFAAVTGATAAFWGGLAALLRGAAAAAG